MHTNLTKWNNFIFDRGINLCLFNFLFFEFDMPKLYHQKSSFKCRNILVFKYLTYLCCTLTYIIETCNKPFSREIYYIACLFCLTDVSVEYSTMKLLPSLDCLFIIKDFVLCACTKNRKENYRNSFCIFY